MSQSTIFLLWDDSSFCSHHVLFNTPAVNDFVGAPWRNLAYTPQPWSVLNGANHCKALKSEISYVSHYLPNPKLYAYWRPELCKSLCRYSCWCSERLELSYLSTSSWYQLAHCFIGAISGRSVGFRRILVCIQILDSLTMWSFMRMQAVHETPVSEPRGAGGLQPMPPQQQQHIINIR